MELLSPAGSPDALAAAVQNGANAVYLGCGDFNARRRAKNFTAEDLAPAVAYCHVRGVKVYLTLNTLLTTKELPAALSVAKAAEAAGVDAVLVQDLGLAALLRRELPSLPLHGSTQMTVHSLAGVEFCAALGMERVVLSRELSKEAIAYICQKSPIEIEVFVHGALCMCYSGQCFLSALVGGRSGNRGLCAQPCRLPYNGSHPLSLKDMSLAGHLQELRDMGVACVKLEGRMKRPEYVAVVTSVYAAALRESRESTQAELSALQTAFSRSGFTQGYFEGQKGAAMFGTRSEADAPDAAFYAAARASYQKERPLVDVAMKAVIRAGQDVLLTAADPDGRTAQASAPPPEAARKRPLTREDVAAQLSKTGGTPYRAAQLDVLLDEGLSIPVSSINSLRRQVLDALTQQRAAVVKRPPPGQPGGIFPPPDKGASNDLKISSKTPSPYTQSASSLLENASFFPVFSASSLPQFSALLSLPAPHIDLPLHLLANHQSLAAQGIAAGAKLRAVLPSIIWDKEADEVRSQLRTVAALGVQDALAGTWDAAWLARSEGFALWGGHGLGALNEETLKALKILGFSGATASFEQKLSTLKHLPKPLPVEAIVYGRLPLMTLEQFPGGTPCNSLKDRKNVTFPVVSLPGGRARLLNSQVLWLGDKEEWKTAGFSAVRFLFTTETPEECLNVIESYARSAPPPTPNFTRGLYYRDVE